MNDELKVVYGPPPQNVENLTAAEGDEPEEAAAFQADQA